MPEPHAERAVSQEIRIGRVAKAAGISRDQARKAIAAMSSPPSGGPIYRKRMEVFRDLCGSMFGMNAMLMSDATLEKRLSRYPKCAAIIRWAKEADAMLSVPPTEGEGDGR